MKSLIQTTSSRIGLATLLGLSVLAGGCATTGDSQEDRGPIPYPGPPEQARFYFEQTIGSTADVKTPSSEDKLKALLTGQANSDGIPFGKPFDVAVHRGRVFVSDSARRLVQALDFGEHKSFQIGDRGDGGDLNKPLGLAVDRNGTLFVADITQKSILVYDRDGNFQRRIGEVGTFDRPSGLDVSKDGNLLFVVDTGGVESRKHRILVFDAVTGEHLRDISTRGSEEGELNLPRDVKLGPDGLLYVTDGGNFRVQAFTQEGEYVRHWGRPGKRFGQFTRPKGITVDPDGNVYVVDAAFGNFQIFNEEGELLLFIGERSTAHGPGLYMLPAGIDVDEDGRVYIVDQYFRKVEVFRPASVGEDEGYLAGAPRALAIETPTTSEPPASAEADTESTPPTSSEADAESEQPLNPEAAQPLSAETQPETN